MARHCVTLLNSNKNSRPLLEYNVDTTYIWDLENQEKHIGILGSVIKFVEDGNWKFTRRDYIPWLSYRQKIITTKIAAGTGSLA